MYARNDRPTLSGPPRELPWKSRRVAAEPLEAERVAMPCGRLRTEDESTFPGMDHHDPDPGRPVGNSPERALGALAVCGITRLERPTRTVDRPQGTT
jgi:hypothetical protein